MEFVIRISTNNSYFKDDDGSLNMDSIAHTLDNVSARVKTVSGQAGDLEGDVKDGNGNTVGEFGLIENTDDE